MCVPYSAEKEKGQVREIKIPFLPLFLREYM